MAVNALVLYESWFGNTRRIAEEVTAGLVDEDVAALAMAVDDCAATDLREVGLVVVGAPTHTHGLPTPRSRAEARRWSQSPANRVDLEADTSRPGVREWLDRVPDLVHPRFAAFETRADLAPLFGASSARRIARSLISHGWEQLTPPASFIMPSHGLTLADGGEEEARSWGSRLGLAFRLELDAVH
ncbi:flavodoxin domain-containing protein [Herbiconiux sp. L3-i23]|uniref:flavodoxin family protein n=1 Tax=Herbiconiux sp. L3-i23 TaxID=2905871 RepID=UPI00204CD51A|nr:flavodoxin domain-containing protein [Herbiconiux sp. L3-i23]BDI23024.1 flavodoxin [Herbiconiux sp. L3-i23]